MSGRKTVIVVVEGNIDVICLRGPLETALSALDLQPLFAVSDTDLTSDKGSTPDNIVQRVETEVWEAMDKVGLEVADIARIVQVTDLDGAYVPNADIHIVSKKDQLRDVTHLADGIYANQASGIPARNARKKIKCAALPNGTPEWTRCLSAVLHVM